MSFQIVLGYTNEDGVRFCNDEVQKKPNHNEIIDFIEKYATTINSASLTDFKNRYSRSVLFASKDTNQSVPIEKMSVIVQKMTQNFKNIGYLESNITKAEYFELDISHYLLKIYIKMNFLRNNIQQSIENIKATYIVAKEEGKWKMIMQIDHQDLSYQLKQIGIQ
jgi:hypothetical protein